MIGTSEALLLLLILFFIIIICLLLLLSFICFFFCFFNHPISRSICILPIRGEIYNCSFKFHYYYLFIYLFLKGCDLYVLSAFISLSHFIKCHTNVKAIFL